MALGSKSGEAPLPALVMVHGFALDARMWRRQVAAFSRNFRVMTVNLPGFGAQAHAVGTVSPTLEVARALAAAKVDKAHFMAHSFGATVATDFALHFPDRVESLTLVAPALLGRSTGIESWHRSASLATNGDTRAAAEVWLDDELYDGIRQDENLYEEVREMILDYGGAHWTGGVSSVWSVSDHAANLHKLGVPVLIISGGADLPSFLQMADEYVDAIARARHEIISGAGHLTNLERPEEFNTRVRNFLKFACQEDGSA